MLQSEAYITIHMEGNIISVREFFYLLGIANK